MENLNIIFEFVGGPDDGKIATGRLGEASEAERYYLFTNRGRVGQRIKIASDYSVNSLAKDWPVRKFPGAFRHHYYVVTDRLEDREEVWVRAEYQPN
jgi:hypothetical protein